MRPGGKADLTFGTFWVVVSIVLRVTTDELWMSGAFFGIGSYVLMSAWVDRIVADAESKADE